MEICTLEYFISMEIQEILEQVISEKEGVEKGTVEWRWGWKGYKL